MNTPVILMEDLNDEATAEEMLTELVFLDALEAFVAEVTERSPK